MTWHYRCPDCGYPIQVEWSRVQEERACPHCHKSHFPPTPGEDHLAFVATDKVPSDMVAAVLALRGTTCAIPGCFREHSQLVHRKPASAGGQTSVENLLPMCHEHASSKGEKDYDEWLATLPKSLPDESMPQFEITFTNRAGREKESAAPAAVHPAARPVPAQHPRPPARVQSIAGRVDLADELPETMHLVTAKPFLSGSVRRLVLHYGWHLEPGEACRVILAAWPIAEEPDFSHGSAGLSDMEAVNEHRADNGEHGASRLELPIPARADSPWIAAVFEEDSRSQHVVRNYLLVSSG